MTPFHRKVSFLQPIRQLSRGAFRAWCPTSDQTWGQRHGHRASDLLACHHLHLSGLPPPVNVERLLTSAQGMHWLIASFVSCGSYLPNKTVKVLRAETRQISSPFSAHQPWRVQVLGVKRRKCGADVLRQHPGSEGPCSALGSTWSRFPTA